MSDVVATIPINNLTHPYYALRERDWYKWRLTYEGTTAFLEEYLRRFTKAEDKEDFEVRKRASYVPAFAKAAIVEVRNSIYQRLCDINRSGGSPTYSQAMEGKIGGVDLQGSSMNTFMGTEVLEELLSMGKVGIYVDMPPKQGETLADNKYVRPYIYIYKTEDIRSWDWDDSPTPNQYRALLLRDTIFVKNNETGLPSGTTHRYRYYYKDGNSGTVWVQFYDAENVPVGPNGEDDGVAINLGIKEIPFVTLELNNSLLSDIADYQIALLNLASSDLSYAIRSNFPFYIEQFDPRFEAIHTKQGNDNLVSDGEGGVVDETISVGVANPNRTVTVGPTTGRRYPKGLDAPEFIHPSPEPLQASMAKQDQLKLEIRLLINLSIANIQPKMASAESKAIDERTLESGLGYVGLIMEDAERRVAWLWNLYENKNDDYKIKYPEKYNIRSEKDVWAEVDELKKHMSSTPSITCKRAIAKRIATLLVGLRVTFSDLQKIFKEIDAAEVIEVLPEKIDKDVTAGYLSKHLAAKLRGYPEETVDEAQKEQAERLALIKASQTPGQGAGAAGDGVINNQSPNGNDAQHHNQSPNGNPAARGNPDLSATPQQDAKAEKAGKPGRGKAQ